MQTYKCEMCGAGLEPQAGAICTCKYCGTKYSISASGGFGIFSGEKNGVSSAAISGIEFSMKAEGVFAIAGRGIAVTGEVALGEIHTGDSVKIMKNNGYNTNCTVVAIEQFRKMLDSAKKGDKIGLILSGITKEQIEVGDKVIKGELDPQAIADYIRGRYLPTGEKVKAIDFYRRAAGVGLREAKDKIDAIFSGR